MSKGWDDRAEEDLDPSIKTGVGNPLSPYTEELLSEEDEKRVDDKGHKVVHKATWSSVPTNVYYWVAAWTGTELTQLVPGGRGQTDIQIVHNHNLSQGISLGKPRFNLATHGACIELPSDLGEDVLKQKYLIEWIVETADESLSGLDISLTPDKRKDLGFLLASAADRAIGTVL